MSSSFMATQTVKLLPSNFTIFVVNFELYLDPYSLWTNCLFSENSSILHSSLKRTSFKKDGCSLTWSLHVSFILLLLGYPPLNVIHLARLNHHRAESSSTVIYSMIVDGFSLNSDEFKGSWVPRQYIPPKWHMIDYTM